jgi:hypothetical protein
MNKLNEENRIIQTQILAIEYADSWVKSHFKNKNVGYEKFARGILKCFLFDGLEEKLPESRIKEIQRVLRGDLELRQKIKMKAKEINNEQKHD